MKTQEVTIKGKGYKLAGTLVIPNKTSKKLPAVIFYHGMVSQSKPRYVKRAQALAKEEIATLTFDFRGCGESDGKLGQLSIADWFGDALLAFNFLANQPFVDQKRIGVSGKSFGGYMGALVSEKRSIRSMVFQAPAVYEDIFFNSLYTPEEYEKGKYSKQQRTEYRNSLSALNNKAITAIKKFTNPLLIVGSELDDTVPSNVVEGFYNASPSKKKNIIWIKGADHPLRNEKHNQEYTKLMIDWFKKTL